MNFREDLTILVLLDWQFFLGLYKFIKERWWNLINLSTEVIWRLALQAEHTFFKIDGIVSNLCNEEVIVVDDMD